MADPFAPRSMKRKNVKGLALTPAAPKPPPTAETARHDDQTEKLEIGIEYNLDLRPSDLEFIKEIGSGNGGTVSKVRHIPTDTIIARKVIHVEAKKEMRKRIVRELQIMRDCHSEYIVTFYGSFLNDNNDVIMCMENMDVGSLDWVSRMFGPVRVDVLGKIAEATLGGLTYLYVKHHIMHRDIKPSNILVNSRGSIKLCDFGVSGELINSIADTFVGTSTYMAPERIQGERYTVKSDVWSFGLTIMEMAIGKFPFAASEHLSDAESAPAGILDLLQQIVHEPAPRLPKSDAFPAILEDMIQRCLYKDPNERPTPQELFERDPFVQAAKRTPVDLREWAVGMMERDNRKSHLAPQLSPATQDLLRSLDSATIHGDDRASTLETPTSGEIPIVGEILSPRDQLGASIPIRSPTTRSAELGSAGISNGLGSATISSANGSSGGGVAGVVGVGSSGVGGGGGSSSARFGSIGRAGGQAVHPGLGARVATDEAVPRVSSSSAAASAALPPVPPASAGARPATFSLPVRPAPRAGGAPPPPPKKETAEELRWRQQQQQQQKQQQQQQQQYQDVYQAQYQERYVEQYPEQRYVERHPERHPERYQERYQEQYAEYDDHRPQQAQQQPAHQQHYQPAVYTPSTSSGYPAGYAANPAK